MLVKSCEYAWKKLKKLSVKETLCQWKTEKKSKVAFAHTVGFERENPNTDGNGTGSQNDKYGNGAENLFVFGFMVRNKTET